MPKMLVERKCFSNLLLVFHLLKLGRLMQTMNAWKDFFAFLKVDKLPNMHCSDSNKWGWKIVCIMWSWQLLNMQSKRAFFLHEL
jgi:hypothetical protein